ncbi:hypothetical protein LguiB_000279 [Lonicera macranthoides]
MEEEEEEIIKPYELNFSDLILLSSDKPLSSFSLASEEIERLQSITSTIMENLGPRGPGLIVITGVANTSTLRRTLLPLARKLSLLNFDDRKLVLKGHGLGSDVPLKNSDRTVSPFAMQLKCVQDVEINCSEDGHLGANGHIMEQGNLNFEKPEESQHCEFKNLGSTFKELGFCMMELGRRLARICDRFIGGQELEESLLESGTAKGRLIHYHSTLDNLILKEGLKRKGSNESFLNGSISKKQTNKNQQKTLIEHETQSNSSQSNLWQQWHYDYGIFTILTAPMFMLPCHPQTTMANECPSPSGHTYLQIYYPNRNSIVKVKASHKSFIIQVGESADILSKGKLRSTLHSVCRPTRLENLSRETFVVFLQPAWSKSFSLSDYPTEQLTSCGQRSGDLEDLAQDIDKIVPPLSARLKDGMTFAEFSRETTKQYYGGSGLQSKKEKK